MNWLRQYLSEPRTALRTRDAEGTALYAGDIVELYSRRHADRLTGDYTVVREDIDFSIEDTRTICGQLVVRDPEGEEHEFPVWNSLDGPEVCFDLRKVDDEGEA